MISEILKKVKSPFSDNLIKELIENYIACGCDDNLFYNKVNKLDDTNKSISTSIITLINQIYSQGISKSELWNFPDKEKIQLVYDSNSSWIVLSSEDDPMEDNKRTTDNRRILIYRIYLNLKDKEKANFIENYIKICQKAKMPFEFKFSKDESRLDQIVILSRSENLERNVFLVEKLTKDLQLGSLPILVGEYGNGIGIVEEYYNRLYSPTKVRLALIRSSIKKYLCDHLDEFKNKISDEEKEIISSYIREFNYLYESEKQNLEIFGEEYEDIDKKYYQEKSTIECAKERIENDSDARINEKDLLNLGNVIKYVYLSNSEKFVKEIIQNYRMIGTQVWGLAQDFIFSNETENKFLKSKDGEQNSSKKEETSR